MSTLERAIALAAEAHGGQVDKGGAPYILHPLRVMLASSPEDRAVAVLHDVAEDCDDWPVWRIAMEMGWSGDSEERTALAALTRMEHEAYEAFIGRVSQSPMARRIKLADLADNSDVSRLGREPTPADRKRLERYWNALMVLTGQQKAPATIP
jgi:(p)ppGpp synthase/HD superfamily hydrolase